MIAILIIANPFLNLSKISNELNSSQLLPILKIGLVVAVIACLPDLFLKSDCLSFTYLLTKIRSFIRDFNK